MIDFFGHLAYAVITVGMILLARQNAYGWLVMTVGNLGWIALGIAMAMSSITLWAFLFVVLNLVGWQKWRVKKARYQYNPDDYHLGRGVLFERQIGSVEWVELGTTPDLVIRLADDDDLDTELLREDL